MRQVIYISLLLLLCSRIASAQKFTPVDSLRSSAADMDTNTTIKTEALTIHSEKPVVVAADDTVKKKKIFEPNAKKAGMYSAIFPGFGQAYNRQYWKVPVVYAILGGAGYFIAFNYNKYKDYRQAYIYSIDGDPNTNNDLSSFYDASQLQRLQNNYKKDLDIIVLLTSVGYALQIMDAVASAHLKNFDISRDISMQVKPVLQQNYIGMGLVMNFH